MLSRSNQGKLIFFIVIVAIIFAFDVFTIITNLFVAPYLDGYGLPDIFIYLKTFVFLSLLLVLAVWLSNKHIKLSKSNLKVLMYIALAMIIAYFLSLFMYKYVLLLDTAHIIKFKILYGNPSLIYDFSTINYKTLTYINTIFGGFNSEVVLFVEAMVFEGLCLTIDKLQVTEEPVHNYDSFLFDDVLFPLTLLLVVASFLSMNIFLLRYDLLGSFEMAIGITGFAFSLPALFAAFKLYRTKNHSCTRSFFTGTYKFIMFVAILSTILFAALTILNFSFLYVDRSTYRLISSFAAFVIAVIILFRVRKTLALENKA